LNSKVSEILDRLPDKPGVYQHLDSEGNIIYVGKAKNLKRRVGSYFQKDHTSYKTQQLVKHIADIRYIVVDNEQDAFLLENNLIKRYQPRYNILLKDGKSYPCICITREEYPRVFKTRQKDKRMGELYGPFSFGNTVDIALELIHKLYPIRTCNIAMTAKAVMANKYKVCLKYHIKKCSGCCENKVSPQEYLEQINQIRKIIRGDAHEISINLANQMKTLAAEMRFEEAQQVKQKYDLIEKFKSKTIITNTHLNDFDVFGYDEDDHSVYVSILRIHKGSIIQGQTIEYKKQLDEDREEAFALAIHELREQLDDQSKHILVPFMPGYTEANAEYTIPQSGDTLKLLQLAQQNVSQYKQDRLRQSDKLNPSGRATRVLDMLRKLLNISDLPIRIESFDNSNLQGSDAVASCIVFEQAKPKKSEYKRYIIKTVEGQDDYASMQEIVRRRYSRLLAEKKELPNLIIADGGIGQMNAIREVVKNELNLDIPIAGLVKDSKHQTRELLFGFPPKAIGLKVTDEVFHLLVEIQNEVHRFAISFHKERRSKSQVKSELDEIKGIGPKTKLELIKAFKSLNRLRTAQLPDIEKTVGKHRASIIYEYFNGQKHS